MCFSCMAANLEYPREAIAIGSTYVDTHPLEFCCREPVAIHALMVAGHLDHRNEVGSSRRAAEHLVVAHRFRLRAADDALVDGVRRGQRQLAMEAGVEG